MFAEYILKLKPLDELDKEHQELVKDLIPNKLFDEDELSKILLDFDPNSVSQGIYYNAILQNLFFACVIISLTFAASGLLSSFN